MFLLFKEFLLIGSFAFGGGLAVFPFFQELSEKTHWFTQEELNNILTISEMTPGPLACNMATYVGYKLYGIIGAIIATISIIIPAILLMSLIYKFIKNFKSNPYMQILLKSIKPATLAIIVISVFNLLELTYIKTNIKESISFFDTLNFKCIILGIILFICMKRFKLHPIIYLIISGGLGFIFSVAI